MEAARAGEQGRGFAVVASEVRSLTQRSAQAAAEIKGLIGSSVGKVEAGARLVQGAGETMSEIVASVQRVTDVIGEITAAAAEQSSGIGRVNGAVNSLDQMTQQNAALVEESAAAAESLRDQAAKLSQAMQVFKLSGSGQGHLAAPATGNRAPAAAVIMVNRPVAPVVSVKPASRPAAAAAARVAAPAKAKATAAVAPAPKPIPATTADDGEWESF